MAAAVRDRDTPALYDWLVTELSYQGISDQVAAGYMEHHGKATSQAIAGDLEARPSCPKLASYWHFPTADTARATTPAASQTICRSVLCPILVSERKAEPDGLFAVPVHSRVAGGDLVGWIDRRSTRLPGRQGPAGWPECGQP